MLDHHKDLVIELLEGGNSKSTIARKLKKRFPEYFGDLSFDAVRHKVSRYIKSHSPQRTATIQYPEKSPIELSALKADGSIMTIDEYMRVYGLNPEDYRSWKLVTHTGVPYYNVASKSVSDDQDPPTLEEVKEVIAKGLSQHPKHTPPHTDKTGRVIVATLADLHFGAWVKGLIKTLDYSSPILIEKLEEAARIINSLGASQVHIHFLGDMIESFTGLNHKNSWKGLEAGMYGAEVVKAACNILHTHFLSHITNLVSVQAVGGNHDRVTSDKGEDTEAGAADLIFWGLGLLGYPVTFHPFLLSPTVDGVNYILVHGHDSISKKSTKNICWDYGKQGVFNFVLEGHLHSTIERLSVSQRDSFKTLKDDAVDHRRLICPSFFTGNNFSERLGYTSNSGFIISENNGRGVPHVYFYSL